MNIMRITIALTLAVGVLPAANAAIIASSVDDYTEVQGQAGWSYGFFNQGSDPNALAAYSQAGFREFDLFANNRWEASDSLAGVGDQNNDFLSLNATGGHPSGIGPGAQDAIIWAVRRYVSATNGRVQVSFDLRKGNVDNNRGGGITGRIFIDGVEVFSERIENADGVGVQSLVTLDVTAGSAIDFAIDPLGVLPIDQSSGDGPFSARADRTIFSAVIRDPVAAPEPASIALALVGLLCLFRRWPSDLSVRR